MDTWPSLWCLSAPFPKYPSVWLMNKGDMVTLIKAKYRLNNMDLDLTKVVTPSPNVQFPSSNIKVGASSSVVPTAQWFYLALFSHEGDTNLSSQEYRQSGFKFLLQPIIFLQATSPMKLVDTLYTIIKHINSCRNYLYN